MRLYSLTKLGEKVADKRDDNSDEVRILQYIRANRSATDDDLEVIGASHYKLDELKKCGLVMELTSG